MVIRITVVLLFVALISAQYEGETCKDSRGASGICTEIIKCPSAIQNLKKERVTICSFMKGLPIVCCVNESDQKESPPNYRDTSVHINENECPSIFSMLTTPMTGQKALDKCIEYQQNLIYPCEKSNLPEGGMIRRDYCNLRPEQFVSGGEDTYAGKYPHMALLGYYGEDQTIRWLCGGTLVSDKYVLTAGHCTYGRDVGAVSKIKVGIYSRSESVTDKNEYNVAKILKHPDYKPPISYNDIALLEADRTIYLDRYAVPACLHDGAPVLYNHAIVTGWGTTKYNTNAQADILQEAILNRFSDDECSKKYNDVHRMPSGYNLTTQMCYGDRYSSKDTCQGDSGGPLQMIHPKLPCMYSVIGVTSSGKWCGIAGEPGLYSRVAYYLPWIESIVWP